MLGPDVADREDILIRRSDIASCSDHGRNCFYSSLLLLNAGIRGVSAVFGVTTGPNRTTVHHNLATRFVEMRG
jgi:hypothetical protein